MKIPRSSKKYQFLILQGVAILFVTALVTGSVVQSKSFEVQTQDQSGPALGETINLASFQSRTGRTLAETIKGHSLAMVVLVNPACTTCTATKDTMRDLRTRVAKPGIPYYVLMIPDSSETQKYFSYADSLNLDAESFVWSASDSKPPGSLATMPAPSHLLITNEGLVVNKWLGSTPDSK